MATFYAFRTDDHSGIAKAYVDLRLYELVTNETTGVVTEVEKFATQLKIQGARREEGESIPQVALKVTPNLP